MTIEREILTTADYRGLLQIGETKFRELEKLNLIIEDIRIGRDKRYFRETVERQIKAIGDYYKNIRNAA